MTTTISRTITIDRHIFDDDRLRTGEAGSALPLVAGDDIWHDRCIGCGTIDHHGDRWCSSCDPD